MHGFLNLLKPPGMTSHDAIGYLRRVLKVKKAGHSGTLDPMAAGVLVIALGKATRIIQYLNDEIKSYRGEITFGISTDTQDAEGRVVASKPAGHLDPGRVEETMATFLGEQWQVPPMFSALARGGKRLYQLAREGEEVPREPRPIKIYRWVPVKWYDLGSQFPRLLFDVTCSRGTYVRTLCHDLGERLNIPAHLSFLLRTASGPFSIDQAHTLEEISKAAGDCQVEKMILPMAKGLNHLPFLEVDPAVGYKVRQGGKVSFREIRGVEMELACGAQVVFTRRGEVLAIGTVLTGPGGKKYIQPRTVLV